MKDGGLFSILSNFGAIKKKAPELLAGFLDTLLEENRPLLQPENGEIQICYLMTQKAPKDYTIMIVAVSGDNHILRCLKAIPLNDALETILKNTPNV